jgi:hypothetical protein
MKKINKNKLFIIKQKTKSFFPYIFYLMNELQILKIAKS